MIDDDAIPSELEDAARIHGCTRLGAFVHIFFNLMMAICLLALAPTMVLVILLQKYIVEGLAAGAVKG